MIVKIRMYITLNILFVEKFIINFHVFHICYFIGYFLNILFHYQIFDDKALPFAGIFTHVE